MTFSTNSSNLIISSPSKPSLSPPAYPIQSFEILRNDTTSATLLEPFQDLDSDSKTRFGVRIHSDSIYLYRSNQSNILLFDEKPVMEASIKGFINSRDAKLDDWRERRRGNQGKYKLRHRHGM